MAVIYNSNKAQVLAALQQAMDRGLEICGGQAETYAKRLCPTKTSRLKNSIAHEQMDEKTEVIGTNVKYARYVELGHHQEPGRYVPAIKKRLKRSWVPPKPFLRPAVENHMDEYNQIIDNELKKG